MAKWAFIWEKKGGYKGLRGVLNIAPNKKIAKRRRSFYKGAGYTVTRLAKWVD